jgi:FtsH-binding integral membrane protein
MLSHWFLDLIVHVPDRPLSPFGDFKGGLGLWNNVAAALIIETIIFITGVYIYATFTNSKNKIGNWVLWTLVIFLLIFNFANTFGQTPPDSIMILFVSSIA